MNKTILKIFVSFVLLSALISTILLGINILGAAFIGSDTGNVYPNNQRYVLEQISKNLSVGEEIRLTDTRVIPKDNWCILIDENGEVIWSHNRPDDIPDHYSINDVAKMTHWYLNDYPVYVRTEDYGLLVLGIPKNHVGKYDIQYSMDWFDSLPTRIFIIFLINLALAVMLACIFGMGLYKKIKLLTKGIKDLQQEKSVHLSEKGIFKDVIQNINHTSDSIERKNALLSERDSARSNWIAGISHDIRTPLSMVMGYSESLAKSSGLSAEERKKAEMITAQSVKIKKLIEDLNLISSLEYDMQPSKKKAVRVCPLIRGIASEIINSGIDERYEINLCLQNEQASVMGDEMLLERALFNLINNSIIHNKNGCVIDIEQYTKDKTVYIKIADNGCGVSEDVLRNIEFIPKTAHGLGLPMAYKIFYVHGGKMSVENKNGFSVLINLPMK